MVIILLYLAPAFWFGWLLARWLMQGIAVGLNALPEPVLLGLADTAWLAMFTGSIMVVAGYAVLAWEQLAGRKMPHDMDTLVVFGGIGMLSMAGVLNGWPALLLHSVLAVLIMPNIATSLVRIMCDFTRTAFGTLGTLVGLCIVLLGLHSLTNWVLG